MRIIPADKYRERLDKVCLVKAETVTVMPSTSQKDETIETTRLALESHKNTCDAQLILYDNNSPKQPQRDKLKKITEDLGYTYIYSDLDFSLTGLWNTGTYCSRSKYVVHSSADVLFHDGWLDEIIKIFNLHPGRFKSLHPYTCPSGELQKGVYVRDEDKKGGVISTFDVCCYLNVFERSNMYYWDEAFPVWCSDDDYRMYLEHNRLECGICTGSRVDTVLSGLCRHLDSDTIQKSYTEGAVSKWQRKWFKHVRLSDEELYRLIGKSV